MCQILINSMHSYFCQNSNLFCAFLSCVKILIDSVHSYLVSKFELIPCILILCQKSNLFRTLLFCVKYFLHSYLFKKTCSKHYYFGQNLHYFVNYLLSQTLFYFVRYYLASNINSFGAFLSCVKF